MIKNQKKIKHSFAYSLHVTTIHCNETLQSNVRLQMRPKSMEESRFSFKKVTWVNVTRYRTENRSSGRTYTRQ